MIPVYYWVFVLVYVLALVHGCRTRGWTLLNLFGVGFLLIYIAGSVSLNWSDNHVPLLPGARERMHIVLPQLVQLGGCLALALCLQPSPGVRLDRVDYAGIRQVSWQALAVPALAYLAVAALFIPWSRTPLWNIGRYGLDQMLQARTDMYRNGFLAATAVPRYLILYVLCPALFLQRGIGVRVPVPVLAVFTLFGLLPLAKTFFVLNFGLWALGGYVREGKLTRLLLRMGVVLGGYYWIVRSVYLLTFRRELWEVLLVLAARICQIPVMCAVFYAEKFRFEDQTRTSLVYRWLFGGHIKDLSGDLMWVMTHRAGSAPAGIVGTCYPNLPPALYLPFFALVVAGLAWVSGRLASQADTLGKVVFTLILGIISWFLCAADLFVVLNSYGFLYLATVALLTGKPRRGLLSASLDAGPAPDPGGRLHASC